MKSHLQSSEITHIEINRNCHWCIKYVIWNWDTPFTDDFWLTFSSPLHLCGNVSSLLHSCKHLSVMLRCIAHCMFLWHWSKTKKPVRNHQIFIWTENRCCIISRLLLLLQNVVWVHGDSQWETMTVSVLLHFCRPFLFFF